MKPIIEKQREQEKSNGITDNLLVFWNKHAAELFRQYQKLWKIFEIGLFYLQRGNYDEGNLQKYKQIF